MAHYDQFREEKYRKIDEQVNVTKAHAEVLKYRVQEQLKMIFNELSEIYKMLEELKHD